MNILCKGNAADGTFMQIEDWHGNYPFIPYGNTLAFYPVCKESADDGCFGPRRGETYRFQLEFPSHKEAILAWEDLITGSKTFSELAEEYMVDKKKYMHCI